MSITLSRREFLELSAGTSAMASMAPGMTMMEDELTAPVIGDLIQRGHERVLPDRPDAPHTDGRRSSHHDRSGNRHCA